MRKNSLLAQTIVILLRPLLSMRIKFALSVLMIGLSLRGEAEAQAVLTSGELLISTTQDAPDSTSSYDCSFTMNQGWYPFPQTGAAIPTSIVYRLPDGVTTVVVPFEPNTDHVHPEAGSSYYGGTLTYDSESLVYAFAFMQRDYGSSIPITASMSSTYWGGDLDGYTCSVSVEGSRLPLIPLFLPDTYNLLTGGRVSGMGSIEVGLTSFAVPGDASSPERNLALYRADTNGFVDAISPLSSEDILATIDTSLIEPGMEYFLNLTDTYIAADGSRYSAMTRLYFTAVPEPSAYALTIGAAALAGAMLWKRRRRRQALQSGTTSCVVSRC